MQRMPRALAVLMLLCGLASARQQGELLTVSRNDPFLRTVDSNGVTTQAVFMTLPGFFIIGANGLARHPASSELYGVLRIDTGQRVLAVIEPVTGQATLVGFLGPNIATIAFDNTGRLWAVSGDGSNPAETLFTLDTQTGAATLVMALGNGDDGEALAFHPRDGLLYHASGLTDFAFETIDPNTLVVTPLAPSGSAPLEILAMAALAEDTLVWVDLNNEFGTVTTSGAFQLVGTLDHTAKGIVAPPLLFLETYCTAKVNSLGCSPAISSTGIPSATAASGFIVLCTNTYNQKLGLLLYSIHGRAATPFQGGILCLGAPVDRTVASVSGGHLPQAHDCSGVYRIDMNAFARGARRGEPLPGLSQVGARITCQWWARDPGFAAPNASALSNALEYEIGP